MRLYVNGLNPVVPADRSALPKGGAGQNHFELLADRKTVWCPERPIRLGRDTLYRRGEARDAMNSGGDPAVYVTLADALTLQTAMDPAAARLQAARGDGGLRPPTVAAVVARLQPVPMWRF